MLLYILAIAGTRYLLRRVNETTFLSGIPLSTRAQGMDRIKPARPPHATSTLYPHNLQPGLSLDSCFRLCPSGVRTGGVRGGGTDSRRYRPCGSVHVAAHFISRKKMMVTHRCGSDVPLLSKTLAPNPAPPAVLPNHQSDYDDNYNSTMTTTMAITTAR